MTGDVDVQDDPYRPDYESRRRDVDRPASIYPDRDSNKSFMAGMLIGTITPTVSLSLIFLISAALHPFPELRQSLGIGNDLGWGLALIFFGMPAVDLCLRVLAGLLARKNQFASSFVSGLIVSIVTGYLVVILLGGCLVRM